MTAVEFFLVLGLLVLTCAVSLALGWQAIDRRYSHEVGRSHAAALDRHGTELSIIKDHLDIDVDWEHAGESTVEWSRPAPPHNPSLNTATVREWYSA